MDRIRKKEKINNGGKCKPLSSCNEEGCMLNQECEKSLGIAVTKRSRSNWNDPVALCHRASLRELPSKSFMRNNPLRHSVLPQMMERCRSPSKDLICFEMPSCSGSDPCATFDNVVPGNDDRLIYDGVFRRCTPRKDLPMANTHNPFMWRNPAKESANTAKSLDSYSRDSYFRRSAYHIDSKNPQVLQNDTLPVSKTDSITLTNNTTTHMLDSSVSSRIEKKTRFVGGIFARLSGNKGHKNRLKKRCPSSCANTTTSFHSTKLKKQFQRKDIDKKIGTSSLRRKVEDRIEKQDICTFVSTSNSISSDKCQPKALLMSSVDSTPNKTCLTLAKDDKATHWERMAKRGRAIFLKNRSQQMLKDRFRKYRLVDASGKTVPEAPLTEHSSCVKITASASQDIELSAQKTTQSDEIKKKGESGPFQSCLSATPITQKDLGISPLSELNVTRFFENSNWKQLVSEAEHAVGAHIDQPSHPVDIAKVDASSSEELFFTPSSRSQGLHKSGVLVEHDVVKTEVTDESEADQVILSDCNKSIPQQDSVSSEPLKKMWNIAVEEHTLINSLNEIDNHIVHMQLALKNLIEKRLKVSQKLADVMERKNKLVQSSSGADNDETS